MKVKDKNIKAAYKRFSNEPGPLAPLKEKI
jgi:hypothetical protein